jgi:hypothetical protein
VLIIIGNRAQTTGQTETLLLTHMFALCLRVDDYATDAKLIADDLKLPITKCVPFPDLQINTLPHLTLPIECILCSRH